ncbi:unnamed protein product, partial [marine sediment metagenome]
MKKQKGFTPLEIKIFNRGNLSDDSQDWPGKRFLPVAELTGFTLIELLVVIAIIALLMSILMPALARVRRQAQAAMCMSNLKQMGTAALMYTNDNNGYFNPGSSRGNRFDHWMLAWEPYYRDGDLRCCPTTPKSKSRTDESNQRTNARVPFIGWGIIQGDNQYFKKSH